MKPVRVGDGEEELIVVGGGKEAESDVDDLMNDFVPGECILNLQ